MLVNRLQFWGVIVAAVVLASSITWTSDKLEKAFLTLLEGDCGNGNLLHVDHPIQNEEVKKRIDELIEENKKTQG